MAHAFRPRLRGERLEDKAMLAGDVTVEVVEGNLSIVGDELGNQIVLRAGDEPGQWIVRGMPDAAGVPTTVNGQSDPLVVEGVEDHIRINLGAGDDRLVVREGRVPGVLAINLGEGNDHLQLGQREDSTPTPEESASVSVHDSEDESEDDDPATRPVLSVGDGLLVRGGAGDDEIHLASVQVGGFTRVYAGLGNDIVRLGQPDVAPAASSENAAAITDDGANTGEDSAPAQVRVRGNMAIHLGEGNDRLGLWHTRAGHGLQVHGGLGDDQIGLHALHTPFLAVDAGEGSDNVQLSEVAARLAGVITGAGADEVRIVDSVFGLLDVQLGEGQDQLAVGGTTVHHGARFNGGPGRDTYRPGSNNRFRRVSVVNFELREEQPEAPASLT